MPVASIVLFLLMSATQAGKPLHLDNMDFPAAAEAAARTGKPIYYRGEAIPAMPALYHPPLYVHALAGWFLIFGAGAAQARLFGAACALLLCWLTVRLSRHLLGRSSEEVDWALWPVFLLQAHTLQSTGVLDIDTSIYGPLLLLLVGAAAWIGSRRLGPRVAWWEVALLGALVALSLWAKLTTVLLVLATLPLLLWPRLRPWRAMVVAAAASLLGVGIFLATFTLYSHWVGTELRFTFGFLVKSFQRGGAVPPYAGNLEAMVPFVGKWTGLLPWIVAPLVFTPWLPRWFGLEPGRRLQLRTLVGVALLGSVYYMAQTRTFGAAPFKYIFVFWPVVLLPLAWLVGSAAVKLAEQPALRVPGGVVVLPLAMAAVGSVIVPRVHDSHLHQQGFTGSGALLLLVLPGVLAVVAAGWCVRRFDRLGALLWLGAATLQVAFQTGVALSQVRAPHSTDYDYGQVGIEDAIGYVRAHTLETDVISSMKDVGYQARRRYFENYQGLYGGPDQAAQLISAWESGQVRLLVFTEAIGQDQVVIQPVLAQWLERHAKLEAVLGHYRIYRPLPRPAPAPAAAP